MYRLNEVFLKIYLKELVCKFEQTLNVRQDLTDLGLIRPIKICSLFIWWLSEEN